MNAFWLQVQRELQIYSDYNGQASTRKHLAIHAQQLLKIFPAFTESKVLSEFQPRLSHGTLILPLDHAVHLEIMFEDEQFSIEQYEDDTVLWANQVEPHELVSELEKFMNKFRK